MNENVSAELLSFLRWGVLLQFKDKNLRGIHWKESMKWS